MKLFFTTLLLSFFVLTSFASEKPLPKRICATHQVEHQHLLDNYSLEQLSTLLYNGRKAEDTSYSVPVVNSDTTYTIQVVVHVVYLNDNKYENPSDEIIQSQIEALNRDFNLQNELSHIRQEFFPFIGNAKIRFELAKVNPNGKPTTGITRKKSSPILLPDWNPVVDNIKNAAAGGVNPWRPVQYLNIWVCDLNISNRIKKNEVELKPDVGMLGGVANPPKGLPNWSANLIGIDQELAATPAIRQGVVIDFRFFGQFNEYNKDFFNSSIHYGLGRTTVHEVGHYLGLRHTWGDYGYVFGLPCADFDDGIKDTPNSEGPYANNIVSGNICGIDVNSCNVPYPGDGIDYPDMRENYMDYSTDACYGMFTKEQVNMMRYALTEKRGGIIAKREIVTVVPTGIDTKPTLEASVHPNPAQDILNVRLSQMIDADANIQIFNTIGQNVHLEKLPRGIKERSISLQNLTPGMYIIHIEQSGKSFTQRFIKQ